MIAHADYVNLICRILYFFKVIYKTKIYNVTSGLCDMEDLIFL